MTFAATGPVKRNIAGDLWELIYTFTGASGDTGGTISSPLGTIREVTGSGEKSDGSANLAALVVGITATTGQIRITYTDPTANHKGRVTVRGKY